MGPDHGRAGVAYAGSNPALSAKRSEAKRSEAKRRQTAQAPAFPVTAAFFEQVATDVHEVVTPDAGHFIPEEDPGFLIRCAQLFFARSPNPHLPGDFAACVF
jgi:pimeloyl-ACP methyl ester carboxylesterase